MRILSALVAAMLATASPAWAIEAGAVGKVLAATDAHGGAGRSGSRSLEAGSVIHAGDRITTDAAGQVQILLANGSRIALGPHSSLAVERDGRDGAALSALVGSFRFIGAEGSGADHAISTPHATIAARGAAVDFTVYGGRTSLVLVRGTTRLCSQGGTCAAIERSCELVWSDARNGLGILGRDWQQAAPAAAGFPYIAAQDSLRADFRLDLRSCGGEWMRWERPEPDRAAAPDGASGPGPEPDSGPVADAGGDPAPAPEPSTDGGRGDNGLGNGGEETQGEDPASGGDPSNPGGGGKGKGKV